MRPLNIFNVKRTIVSFASALFVSSSAFGSHNAPGTVQSKSDWDSAIADVSPTADNTNDASTLYFFYATTDSAFPGNGTAVDDNVNGTSRQSPASSGFTGVGHINSNIGPLKANTPFYIYARACESTNTSLCSAWTKLSTDPIATKSLSTNPGFLSVDKSNQGNGYVSGPGASLAINLKASNALSSRQFAQYWHYQLNGGGDVRAPYNRSTDALPITSGLTPNTKYVLTENVEYYFGDTTSDYTPPTSPIWTTPSNPGTVSAAGPTHCSVTITSLNNAAGSPANPSYTPYNLCASGAGGSCKSVPIGTTGSTSTVIIGLLPGTQYTPSATALVGNGSDSTANVWNNSNSVSGTQFWTLSWGSPTGAASSIGTTSAIYKVTGIDNVGGSIVSYQLVINGANSGAPVVWTGGTTSNESITINLSGLTPNTQYTAQIKLNEATCGTNAFASASFTTDPFDPTGGSLTSPDPRTVTAAWTDPSANPSNQSYSVKVCTNAGLTTGCQRTTVTNKGLTTNFVALPETQYWGQVTALTVGGGSNGNPVSLGTVTTANEKPTITAIAPVAYTSSATFTPTITDNGPSSELVCHWTVTSKPSSGATATFRANDNNAVCTQAILDFNPSGPYTVQLIVRDKNDTGATSDPRTASITPGQTTTTIDAIVAENGSTVVVGFTKSFRTIVRDQFGNEMVGQGVNWGLSNGGASNTPVAASTFTRVTGVNSTLSPVTLTASLPGASSKSIAITVAASGPQFTQDPTMALRGDGKTADLKAQAIDNSPGSGTMKYTWSLESGPSAVVVSPNGTNTAANAVATFTKAGTYVMRCTIQDNFATDSKVTNSTTVVQNLTAITVSPDKITVKTLQDQKFTANGLDQFNDPMNPSNVVWSTSGGNISGAGVFNSPSLGQNFIVRARSGNIAGQATITVISYDLGAAKAYPVPFKANNPNHKVIHFTGLGTSAKIRIYTTSGHKVFHKDDVSDSFDWDVKNDSGENLASGIYLYIIESPEQKKDGKLIIVR